MDALTAFEAIAAASPTVILAAGLVIVWRAWEKDRQQYRVDVRRMSEVLEAFTAAVNRTGRR